MKMSQAYKVVGILYTHGSSVGWLKRARRSPRFVVGYTTCDVHGAKAHSAGASNVDWVSAFEIAAQNDESQRARIYAAMDAAMAHPAQAVACPFCGEDPGDPCRYETRVGAPQMARPHRQRIAAWRAS